VITEKKLDKVRRLRAIAAERGQSMAQLAIAWTLRNPVITSSLIGASKVSQIEDCVKTLENPALSAEELKKIEDILS